MFYRSLFIALLLAVGSLPIAGRAGSLEDGLLAGAAARLDVKGVEVALRRGAKAAQELPHPDAPAVVRTPVQLVLSALIAEDKPDAAKRADLILRALFKAGAKLTGDKEELFTVIAGGYNQLMKVLLEQGANPHARIYGYTPAELAIKYGQTSLLSELYSRESLQNLPTGTGSATLKP